METAMIFTTRDLDILRFLRWCRFVLAEDLTDVFSKIEVQTLEILRLIKLYCPAQAYMPVSYTHLDVYKRQHPDSPEPCLWFHPS